MSKSNKKSKKKEPSISKSDKLFQNLLKITEQFMSGKSFSPLTAEDLMQRLSLPSQHEELFQAVLDKLADLKLVEIVNGRYTWIKSQQEVVIGTLRMHARGFGFVQLDDPSIYSEDIFIPKHLTKNAVDGDRVEVWVNPEVSEKGPEGKILNILERARTHIGGIIRFIDRHDQFIAYVPLLGPQQRVVVYPSPDHQLKVGDRIVMEIVEWGSKETETICRMTRYLGHISDPTCDIPAAVEEYELRSTFPKYVIEEAHSLGKRVSLKDIRQREDLRHLTTFTIDPDTAKDFDDALSLTKDKQGIYHLGVHIADVSHYVKSDSALDAEAQLRCNSTYFPRYCIPMLPGDLSENLCSLKPNVNRLTVSVLMRLDPAGTLLDYRITRSVIKSVKRFTYREAKKVLDGEMKSPHAPTLNLMTELCHLLKKKRYERGSIEFSLPELVVLVDQDGAPYSTDYIVYDITHQMVEEFMLKANEIVAWDLSQKGKNLTYRVHDVPAEENLREFSVLATAFGFRLPDYPTPQDLQKLFEEASNTPYSNYLASNYIRRMRLAIYSPENIGHYGLSLEHYCHFTSPIRRYVDLVAHRILFGESDDLEYLQQIAQQCSEQERTSAKAEMSVVLLKKLRLLHGHYTKDPYREYEAIITRVKNFGLYFEIIDLLFEGFIHISDLGDDYFFYEEEQMQLKGRHEGQVYAPGDRMTVMLKDLNFITQETSWYIVNTEHTKRPAKKAKKSKKKTKEVFKSKGERKKTPNPKATGQKSMKKKDKPKAKSAPSSNEGGRQPFAPSHLEKFIPGKKAPSKRKK